MAVANPYESLEARAKQALAPWDGSLELTWRCNERCAMCYLGPDWGKGRKKDELSTAEVIGLLGELQEAGCFELMLTGGEVCLRKDFVEIVNHAGSLGFMLTLKTNGTMVTRELAEAIRNNPIRKVDMSLLGASAETHDTVTKIPGSFGKTLRGIEHIRAAGMNVKLNYTALKLNYREVVEAGRLARSLGCEFEWSSQVTPRDDRSVIPLTLRLDDPQMKEMQELKVAQVAEEFGDWQATEYSNEGWFCGAGRYSFNITPYGEVQPCLLMRMDCGNIRDQPFMDIWRNGAEFLRLRSMRIQNVYGCNECEIREYCSACPGMFFMEMGDVTMPSPHTCRQTELKHQAATGVFKPAGSRDTDGEFPRPANNLFGGMGHQPVPLRVLPRSDG
jgi:radical SAM protein with 4Fe4S-binding SPASM domain